MIVKDKKINFQKKIYEDFYDFGIVRHSHKANMIQKIIAELHQNGNAGKTPKGKPGSSQSICPQYKVDGCHFYHQVYGGEMGGKERLNGFCVMVRVRSEEARAVRNWLMVAACCQPLLH